MEEPFVESTISCFGVFHHETCKKISSQAHLICSLQDRISVLESTVAVSRRIPDDTPTTAFDALKEQFAQRDAEREHQLDELTRLLLEQCEQKAEEDEELNALVMEKHELLLTLGQTLTSQQERIHQLEIALSTNITGEEKNNFLLSMPDRGPSSNSSFAMDRQSTSLEDLQTALAEMQVKLHQVQEAAENREFLLNDQIDMLRSALQLSADWEVKRDNNSIGSNRIFFYNNKTNEFRWDAPTTQEYMIPSTTPPTTAAEKRIEQQPLHENQRPSMTQPLLPANWVVMEDITTNTTYYYNKISGKSQWELPVSPVVKTIATLFRPNKNKR